MSKKNKPKTRELRKITNRIKKILKIILAIIIFVGTIYIIGCINKYQEDYNEEQTLAEEAKRAEEEALEAQKEADYNACLIKTYTSDELTNSLNNKIAEIDSLLSNYSVSVTYYEPVTGFTYKYNDSQLYYAASTIKMLDALYIYTNASNGLIDLDTLITYEKSDRMGDSYYMKSYSIGDQVSLRDLVKYVITMSDNTAHSMLIKYIGFQNLKNYGKSLGAVYTLNGGDNFGYINNSDSIIYLTNLYNYINNNSELGEELKNYFINSDQNYLSLPDYNIVSAEKYGQYSSIYHENGIVYTDNPYLVSILTKEGNHDYESIIKNINSKIYELHALFESTRETSCYTKVYEN